MSPENRTAIRFLLERNLPCLGVRERMEDTSNALVLWGYDTYAQELGTGEIKVFWKATQVDEDGTMSYVDIVCGIFKAEDCAAIADAFSRAITDIILRGALQGAVDAKEKQKR